jgi:tetratricopeptide (TPR) repeat protein
MLRIRLITPSVVMIFILLSGLLASPLAASDNGVCDVDADFALGRENYANAIMLHRRFLSSHPCNALAHYHLGFAYGMMGLASEELGEYLTAARLGLKNWDLFLNLGLAYFAQHKPARAIEALQTAAVLGPEHAEPHFNLALVYERESRFSTALSEIEAARHLAPNDPDVANTNAIICVEMGNAGLAYDIWRVLIRSAPHYAPARINLAIVSRSHPENNTTRALSENTDLGSHNGGEH